MDDLEKLLPDFDDLEKLATAASRSQLKAEQCYREIKDKEAMYIRNCILNTDYWPSGKRPAETGTYLTKVVPRLGNTAEESAKLLDLRGQHMEARAAAQEARDLLDLGKKRIDVFQTISANRRSTLAF